MCWSHKLNATQGSACVVEMLTRAVIARYHCCRNENTSDETTHKYTDTSSSMEGFAADKCFGKLVRDSIPIIFACFDGDASTPQHFYSHYPDGTAVRDPNHIAKNIYKQLLATYDVLKYSCSCAYKKNKDGTNSKSKVHNMITKTKAKSAQVWVGKILRENTDQKVAMKLLQNLLRT